MKKIRIAVIGSGIAGMAVAIRMKSNGFDVDVYEKNEQPGGKIGEVVKDGFRFDTGPSLFTLPELLAELYHCAQTPQENRIQIDSLPVICKYFFADHKEIVVPSDPKAFAVAAEEQLGEPAENVLQYLKEVGNLYDLTSKIFLFSPFQKLSTLFQKHHFGIALRLHKLRSLISLHRYNQRSWLTPHMIQLFDRYATYNGSSPYRTPATLRMIAHLEHNLGAGFPSGGMRGIIHSLKKEADRLGVNFFFNTPVTAILTSSGKASGIRTGRYEMLYDHVVSNADITHTYLHLLPGTKTPLKPEKQPLSSSAIIFYWGIRGEHPQLGLHNILFGGHYHEEFAAIFDRKEMPVDPTVYIYISARTNPSDAPVGCENWFVMVNAPPDFNQFTTEEVNRVKGMILHKIKVALGIDLLPLLMSETINTPATLATQTNAFHGALYGNASNSLGSAFMRHPNFSRKIKNLWFAGGTVHPGGGIPLCLASAKIVADLILKQNPGQKKTESA